MPQFKAIRNRYEAHGTRHWAPACWSSFTSRPPPSTSSYNALYWRFLKLVISRTSNCPLDRECPFSQMPAGQRPSHSSWLLSVLRIKSKLHCGPQGTVSLCLGTTCPPVPCFAVTLVFSWFLKPPVFFGLTALAWVPPSAWNTLHLPFSGWGLLGVYVSASPFREAFCDPSPREGPPSLFCSLFPSWHLLKLACASCISLAIRILPTLPAKMLAPWHQGHCSLPYWVPTTKWVTGACSAPSQLHSSLKPFSGIPVEWITPLPGLVCSSFNC